MTSTELSKALKDEAARLGFNACGIAKADALSNEADILQDWLDRGYNASMDWMHCYLDKRTDPRKLVDNATSVISVVHSYYNDEPYNPDESLGKISRYAWNKDYHKVLRKKLANLLKWLNEQAGPVNGRAFVDSAPVMDKVWAQKSGLGWIGKHSNVINRRLGSYFFIGELIVDIPLQYDRPETDHCGSCTKCIDACPTDAITQPYVVDANKCISYLTIEHNEDDIDPDLQEKSGNWIFGCDICQEVCPWNKFSVETDEQRFQPVDDRSRTELDTWIEITEEDFHKTFAGSAVRRTGYEGFKRNVRTAINNRNEEHKN